MKLMTKEEYRTKHKKCKWCIHCRLNPIHQIGIPIKPYCTCDIKDKVVKENTPKLFCKCFELNLQDNIKLSKGIPTPKGVKNE